MMHEKILKRDDGSRVKIKVSLNNYLSRGNLQYSTMVFSCEKGKRTWRSTFNSDDYTYRKLSMDGRREFEYKSQFNIVTEIELQQARLELWEKLKPTPQK
jgi:hypothetical protein